jgi:hypothetical protein
MSSMSGHNHQAAFNEFIKENYWPFCPAKNDMTTPEARINNIPSGKTNDKGFFRFIRFSLYEKHLYSC